MIIRRRQQGVAVLSVVLALAIIGILSHMYLAPAPGGGPGAKPFVFTIPDRARSAVCDQNRRTAQTNLMMDQIDAGTTRLSAEQLQDSARSFPRCPGDGRYYFANEEINCTQHTITPKYRERLGII